MVDTSKFAQDGGAGDAADALGFLQSDKTDGVFAMYRVDNAMATYTFDVAGYTNLSVSMDWACSGNMPDLGVSVGATLDGGTLQTLFEIGSSDGSVTYVMEDGRKIVETKYATVYANAVFLGVVRNEFQRFEASVDDDDGGQVLTLTIEQLNGIGDRAIGFDNLRVYGDPLFSSHAPAPTSSLTPAAATTQPATTIAATATSSPTTAMPTPVPTSISTADLAPSPTVDLTAEPTNPTSAPTTPTEAPTNSPTISPTNGQSTQPMVSKETNHTVYHIATLFQHGAHMFDLRCGLLPVARKGWVQQHVLNLA